MTGEASTQRPAPGRWGRRFPRPVLLGVPALALAASLLAFLAGWFPTGPGPGVALMAGISNPVRATAATLRTELRSEHLSFRYVTCVKNGRAYQDRPVIRCNVNFGDPHVQAYCTVIIDGRLVTNYQNPAIACRPDLAGSTPVFFPPAPRARAHEPSPSAG